MELAKVAPLKKINFIIGQNNSGKSNVINFLNQNYHFLYNSAKNTHQPALNGKNSFQEIDHPISPTLIKPRIAFPLALVDVGDYVNQKLGSSNSQINQFAIRVLKSCYPTDKEFIWFIYGANSTQEKFKLQVDANNAAAEAPHSQQWNHLWQTLTRRSGGDLGTWVRETLDALAYIPNNCPKVEMIPAIRRIGDPNTGQPSDDHSGAGIIDRLAQLQNPSLSNRQDKEKFDRITKFVRKVLENDSAELEIPHARDMILVHMDGKTLPLQSLGTGIHEVIILALAATLLENSILCIEEPELHLHPALQRKLVKYLDSETNNQYLFTTHSAHLMDAVESEILHVSHSPKGSSIYSVGNDTEKANICRDLGYKASDILQANALIWVEGPSDRVYLNFWIRAKKPALIEGVHYSIMFYGGRLFSHITAEAKANDQLVEDLISIRKLNQNTSIIFDSDKSKPRAQLTETKKRLKREFDTGPGFAWVTSGREVENYLDETALQNVIREVHPSVETFSSSGQWANLLVYKTKKGNKERTANKVKVARLYVEKNKPDFSHLDLKKRVDQMIEFIVKANGGGNLTNP